MCNKKQTKQLPVLLKIHVGIIDLIFSYYNFVDACTKAFCCFNCFLLFLAVIILIKVNIFKFGKYIESLFW